MPIVALTVPVMLPVAQLRQALQRGLPLWQWRCGEEDNGAANDRAMFDRPQTIMGRSPSGMVMTSIEAINAPLPLEAGAPPHHRHLKLSQPTTEDAELAKRMSVIIAAAVVAEQDPQAHCQIAPGGRWYSAQELREGLALLTGKTGQPASVDEFLVTRGAAPASAAAAGSAAPSLLEPSRRTPAETLAIGADVGLNFAKILAEVAGEDTARQLGYAPPPPYAEEKPRVDRLPTMVLALNGPLSFDWGAVGGFFEGWDKPGNWRVDCAPDGSGTITGRGATTRLEVRNEPIPTYCIDNALSRSFWLRGDRSIVADMRLQLIVSCELDTRAAEFEDVRETAKLLTVVIGLLSREPQCSAVLNAGVGTILPADMVQEQVGHLHKNEIPLMLWTWTAPDSLVANAVSLSTGGMLPFLGYEVEVWNAPGTVESIGDKVSHILNYLLHHGPIVTDGNSFGERPGDRSIRGFFGQSRAQRGQPVRALMLEFDTTDPVRPRPDPVPQPPPAQTYPRRSVAGGFGRKGS